MEKKNKILVYLFLILLFSIILFFIFNKNNVENNNLKKENINNIKNKKENIFSEKDLLNPFDNKNNIASRKFLGKIFNDNTFEIFSNTSGKVLYSPKREGEYIKKGDLVLKVDDKYLLNDLGKVEISKRSSELSLNKILNIKPDKEDFEKIDKNIEKINLAIENTKLNINKIKKDIEIENNNIDIENLNLSIENIENKKKRTENDIKVEINSIIDLLKNLYENDVGKYFVENSNKEKVFAYLIENQNDEEQLENFRFEIENKVNELMNKKKIGEKNDISKINNSVDLFYDYYDFLHHISFDILLLNKKDLAIIESKTENGKKILESKKIVLNKYFSVLEEFENSISKIEKQIEKTKSGKNKVLFSLKNSLKNLENSLEQNKKQIEIFEIDKKKIKLNYEVDVEDIELAKLKIDSSKKNVRTLKERLSDTSIFSPVYGKIISKKIEKNSYINPGSFIMKIESSDISKIIIYVPEDFLDEIKIGKKVLIEDEYIGNITDIENRVDQKNGKIKVEISLNKKIKNFYVGKIVDVKINFYKKNEEIDIPLSAIFTDIDGNNFIYILDKEKKIKKIKIDFNKFENTFVGVKKSFFEKDWMIIKNKTLVE